MRTHPRPILAVCSVEHFEFLRRSTRSMVVRVGAAPTGLRAGALLIDPEYVASLTADEAREALEWTLRNARCWLLPKFHDDALRRIEATFGGAG